MRLAQLDHRDVVLAQLVADLLQRGVGEVPPAHEGLLEHREHLVAPAQRFEVPQPPRGVGLEQLAQQIEGDEAEFVVADAASPTIVRDASDASALYVLMPMRV